MVRKNMQNRPSKRPPKRPPKRKKRKWKNRLINLLLFLMLLVGLALVFNGQIKNWLVWLLNKDNAISKISRDDINRNKNAEADFDFDAVKSVDMNMVLNARFGQSNYAVIGGVAVPSVSINLPIVKGVSNNSLIVGAGTMKPDQEMGKGNYALAGHHMIDKNLLFSPLVRVEIGATVYLTDLTDIYEYKVNFKEYVDPSRVDLIEDVDGKTLVTMVTCDDTGDGRLIVQGEFVKKVPINQADSKMFDAFNLNKNNYEN